MVQVCQCPRQPKDTVIASGCEDAALQCRVQDAGGARWQPQFPAQGASRHLGIGFNAKSPQAIGLSLPRSQYPSRNSFRSLFRACLPKIGEGHAFDLELYVDAIQEGTRYAAEVPPAHYCSAGTVHPLARGFAAWARIGCQDQLKPRGVRRCPCRAVNHQFAALQGLPKGIQDASFILGSLIKEEDSAMCPRGSSGARKSRASADDRSCGGTVVGILERRPPQQRAG